MAAAPRRAALQTRLGLAETSENNGLDAAARTPSHPPRSPLISIPDPSQSPREAPWTEPRPADPPNKGPASTPKSTQSTPARAAARSHTLNGGSASNFGARERAPTSLVFSRGILETKCLASIEVPHFELDEDPSFWKDHNVQVLIRIRPVSAPEIAINGHKRCLIQESAHSLTWTGHPETTFTFDHVACETTSQEKLFRVVGLPMVENCMSGYNGCMFAYGQTGSGKTYTMMGELHDMDNHSEDRGLTPRIFEYLFVRIREEEESRNQEKLRYSCKCSFLEIYNEQITDLLEPSSINLQLREDSKKGVYVENLKEYDVSSVEDILELLMQGTSNRKMAATYMNSESSRSHSVFTCVIESQWEKDSMTHKRYGRLNLVDLAGSERQKSSGAEGERLKEAASINRSLSILGLVIMTLVDITNGKTRHVPYRDSRLTFLLQDSLGGNSKTTIVANISPSMCSSSETLSTLKFAQRAKLIQNNAKVNEDASGDVMSLQRQIQELKHQLTNLENKNGPTSLRYPSSLQAINLGDYSVSHAFCGGEIDPSNDPTLLKQKVNCLEAALAGSLWRESKAEADITRLEAEIKQMNRMASQTPERVETTDYVLVSKSVKLHDDLEDAESLKKQQGDDIVLKLLGDCMAWPFQTEAKTARSSHFMEKKDVVCQNEIGQSSLTNNSLHLRAINDKLENKLQFLTQENIKLKEMVAKRDAEIALLSEEWEKAVVDLTSFLIDGCKSLEDASESVENIVGLFPQGNLLVNEHVERAIEVNIEKEKLISHLQINLKNAQEMQRELRSKLDSLRGATLAITEVLQLENDENSKELFHLKNLLHQNSSRVEELENEVRHKEGLIVEAERRSDVAYRLVKNLYDMNDPKSLEVDGTRFMATERDPEFQLKLDDMPQTVEEKEEAVSLLLKFEKAEETMEEAELMISELLKVIENVRFERDSWKQATQELLAEKSNLVEDLGINSSVAQQNTTLHKHVSAWVGEMAELTLAVKGSFMEVQSAMNEVNVIYSHMISFGRELRRWIDHSKSFLMMQLNMESGSPKCRESEPCPVSQSLQPCTILKNIVDWLPCSYNKDDWEIETSSATKKLHEWTVQIESNHLDLTDDMNLVKEAILSLCVSWDNIVNEIAQKKRFATCAALATKKEVFDRSSTSGKENPTYKQLSSTTSGNDISNHTVVQADLLNGDLAGAVKCENKHDDVRIIEAINDMEDLLNEIEDLKCQCAQLMAPLPELKDDGGLLLYQSDGQKWSSENRDGQKGNMLLFHSIIPKTKIGNQSLQALHTMHSNLLYVTGFLSSILHLDNRRSVNCSLKSVDDICSLEGKLGVICEKWSRNASKQVAVLKDYLSLRREFVKKNNVVEGLFFDLRLLQESASHAKDIKDKTETVDALCQIQHELAMKASVIENMLEKQNVLEANLTQCEDALSTTRSEVEQAQRLCSVLSQEKAELQIFLNDEVSKISQLEKLLEEKCEIIDGLERQILLLNTNVEDNLLSSVEEVKKELERTTLERERLQSEIYDLNNKLEISMTLTDEKEAVVLETRHAAETIKIYAEEKEEEIKILENSIEELEVTIKILEGNVYGLKDDVQHYQQISKNLELQVQTLKERILVVENAAEDYVTEDLPIEERCRLPKKLGENIVNIHEARSYIQDLEMEARYKDEEIEHYKNHIAELILHSEAQSSLFQEKLTALEHKFSSVVIDPATMNRGVYNETEKPCVRARGSGSPFRCITGLVQQRNLEKDQELSNARSRIEELETLLSSKHNEIRQLTTRLAAVDIMAHDVIRDLLGIKLDMTNYADLIDQEQLQRLILRSNELAEEWAAKDIKITNLEMQVDSLVQERNSFNEEINERKAEDFMSQVKIEQLQQREQMLTAQNKILKMDKANLQKKIVEMNEALELLMESDGTGHKQRQRNKECSSHSSTASEFSRRLARSDKLLSRARDELSFSHN